MEKAPTPTKFRSLFQELQGHPKMSEYITDAESDRQKEARENWLCDVLGGVGDVREAVVRHQARYGKTLEIPAFHDSNRSRTRKAYWLLGGRLRCWRNDAAGPLGQLVVLEGSRIECSTIDFSDLPSVAHLRTSSARG